MTESEKELLRRIKPNNQLMASFANFNELDILNSLIEKELVIREPLFDSFSFYRLAVAHENKDLKKLLIFLNIESKERAQDERFYN